MAAETTLVDAGVLFAAVALAGLVARGIDQSVIPFYILVGMVLGPFVLGRLPDALDASITVAGVDPVAELGGLALQETDFVVVGAELGIVLLLFFLGLEFNLERLLASRERIGKAGTVDLLNFAVGLALGWVLFEGFLAAFLVAGVVYISSSAIITKSLIDLGWIANDEADPMLGTLVYEDLFIAVYLAVASAFVLSGGDLSEAAGSVGIGLAFIAAIFLFVYLGTVFFERAVDTDSNEFVVLRVLGITVLIAGAALSLGVSEAVAAFFVGMGFSATDRVHELERLLEPLRDVFAAIFFFWIGLITDPSLFPAVAGPIAVAVLLTTPSKLLTGYWGGRIYDLDERRSTRVALGMTTRGEFSLIIASLAAAGAGVGLPEETAGTIYAFAVGYVLVMSVLGTTLMQHASRIEAVAVPRLEAVRPSPDPTDD